jgi:plastocyanin
MRGGIHTVLTALEPASRSKAHMRQSVGIPITLLLMLLIPADTHARQVDVSVENFLYAPEEVRIRPGDPVTWHNQQGTHSATGRYLYHCTLHFDMTGLVSVTPTASPESGQVGTVFTITVASTDASARLVYDVQKKEPGGGFEGWITVTTPSVEFDSTGQLPGRYKFRARLRKVPENVSSLWSLPVSIRVDPAG